MKQLLLTSVMVFFAIANAFSQSYLDKISAKGCECLAKVPDTLTKDMSNMQLGLCIIEAAMPYKKELKKDFGLDLDKMNTEGEKIGSFLGVKLAGVCPEVIMKLAKSNSAKKEANGGVVDFLETEGIITKVDKDLFVVFTIKDEANKLTRFYWLGVIETNKELSANDPSLVGKKVTISYQNQNFYDPKIDEYRSFSVIKKIEF